MELEENKEGVWSWKKTKREWSWKRTKHKWNRKKAESGVEDGYSWGKTKENRTYYRGKNPEIRDKLISSSASKFSIFIQTQNIDFFIVLIKLKLLI